MEVLDGERVLWVSAMHARSPGSGVRERYVYDGDRTLTAAEDALTVGLGVALTGWTTELPDLVLFVHQDDGDWSDQTLPTIALPTGGEDGANPRQLDATGTPVGDEPRRLLRIVAQRVETLVQHRRGRSPRCVVTTHDPEDILADIRNTP